jgi:hypothetical protein
LPAWDEKAREPRPWAPPGPDPEAISPDRAAVTSQDQSISTPPTESLGSYDDDRDVSVGAPGHSAVSLFWWSVLVLTGIGMVGFAITSGRDSFGLSLILIMLTLPAFQFGAAIVTAIILAVSPRPDKGYQFWQLGKIVLGTVAGTVVGLLLMYAIYRAFSR